jgi:hypothetical protein
MDPEPTEHPSDRQPWTEPSVQKLELSRIANGPPPAGDGSDGQDS